MFNFLKKWMPNRGTQAVAPEPVPPHFPESAPGPESTIAESIPDSPRASVLPKQPLEPSVSSPPESTRPFLSIPRAVIFRHLPFEVKRNNTAKSKEPIRFPLETVLQQLRFGRCSFPIREVRKLDPELIQSVSESESHLTLTIPLSEILPLLPGGALSLNNAPSAPDLPSEIPPIFGPEAQRAKTSPTAARENSGMAETCPAPAIPFAPVPSMSPEPLAQAPIHASARLNGPAETNAFAEPAGAVPIAFALSPTATAAGPAPIVCAPSQIPAMPRAAAPVPKAMATAALEAKPPAPPETPPATLAIPCVQLIHAWPELLRDEWARLDLADRVLHLSLDELEPRLRRGKVEFSWGQLQCWIQPPIQDLQEVVPSECLIELPLPVVAPLFLAKRPPVNSKENRSHFAESVPELFFRGRVNVEQKSPSSANEAEPQASNQPSPLAGGNPIRQMPLTDPSLPAENSGPRFDPGLNGIAPKPVAASKPILEFGEIFGRPKRPHWKPEEIMAETAKLKSVAGALLATTDGLLIAGKLPGNLNGEKVAAFVPQMFGRMSQYARELQFPEPRQLSISLDNVPVQIHQIEKIFFMVLGRAGETLPRIQLSAIATQLHWQATNNLSYGNHQSSNPGTSG